MTTKGKTCHKKCLGNLVKLYSICDSRGSNFDIIFHHLVKYWRLGHKSIHFLKGNDISNTHIVTFA